MKIILTDINYIVEPGATVTGIKERLGWWNDEGEIYIYTPELTKVQIWGFIVHEIIEYFLIKICRCNEKNCWPHRYACIIEMIVTLGRAWDVLCWR